MIDDSRENFNTFASLTTYLNINDILVDNKSVIFFEREIDCKKVLIKNIK